MQWLQTLDEALFRFINAKLANPFFDHLMPFVSGNAFFYPLLLIIAVVLICKGRQRGLICVALLILILPLGDHWVCRIIKRAVARPRPFVVLSDVRQPGAKDHDSSKPATPPDNTKPPVATGSMPSSHAANWFAAAMVAFVYFRRSLWLILPVGLLVSFSRIYNGVHYPSDVLAGGILGAGYAAATIWSLEAVWQWAGRKWFPLWWRAFPSLIALRSADPAAQDPFPPSPASTPHADVDAHWLRLGYIIIAILLFARLSYIAGDTIQLTGDEAYQWLWSKHLALSYYSKPPVIAYAQFIGTTLFGDTAFGVRFFSPVSAAVLSFLLLRFFAREFNARAGFFLVLILTATPLVSAGAVLMTVDVFSVLFWSAAMIAGWRAVQPTSTTSSWLWVGLWMGLGFLSKYTELFQLLCWATFFVLWPASRRHLRSAGPYLALLINFICALPVLIWNQQRHWVTVGHVAADAKAGERWHFTLNYVLDFLGSESLLLNPIFFIGMIWASIAFWRSSRNNPRLIYLFSMGTPLFLAYFVFTLHSRVLPNWIAPSVLPLYCLMVAYWDTRWRLGVRQIKTAFLAGLITGLPVVIIAHDTEVLGKLTGHLLPINQDPLHRARGWKSVARLADEARQELLAQGKPVFIIAAHYRLAGELSFYLPEINAHDVPPVFCRTSEVPVDQFYFWPGYSTRKGENALFVLELDRDIPGAKPAPPQLAREFESVDDLGIREVLDHGRLLWRLQFFACRGLR